MMRLIYSVLLLLASSGAISQNKNFIDQPYIDVSGSADTLVTPNEIFIQIILSEKDTKDRVSLEDMEQQMVDALKSLGLDTEKELSTSDMTSNFRHYILKSKDVIKTKIYTIKVSDAVTASRVFIKLEEIGISNTSITRVDHSELDRLKNLMRTKAIMDAKERAVSLTRPLNQLVGSAIHIADAQIGEGQLQGRVSGLSIRGVAMQHSYKDLPKVDFEKIRVAVSINAKFILR